MPFDLFHNLENALLSGVMSGFSMIFGEIQIDLMVRAPGI